MANLALAFTAASTMLGATSQVMAGRNAAAAGAAEQAQANIAASQAQAASQREAQYQARRGRLVRSRIQALAAASGAGATDPTIVTNQQNVEREATYRSMLALYQGEDQARVLRYRGQIARYEGEQQRRASYVRAATTLLSGGSTFFDKYNTNPATSIGYGTIDPTQADPEQRLNYPY